MSPAFRLLSALVLCSLSNPTLAAQSRDEALVVFAAASLTEVLQEIGANYTKATGIRVRLSFAATSALARQIESGARAQVFLSADQEWMDYLVERGLMDGSSRRDVLRNRLALIAPRQSTTNVTPNDAAGILAALRGHRLAVADPDVVPAGKYAGAALRSIGIWEHVESQLARADSVRAALMYVARGEVPLGIVYATDARVEPGVRALGLFSESTHAPITYPVAALDATNARATTFIEFLSSPQSREIFITAGFDVVKQRN